ncbi:Cyclin, N-terminal domain containing protein [Tritrichomonas foetus]|uniref:Cyclin, N-terminal domain containing protein n=1 Tax=Tritrichomonas foetus TaxID=1144522 RepID=A0A1J4KZV3_9EUKA|nr:Cyclin, N-terminal domain containing protein [Tritrichomonas foetus]|eukprot:OHT16779.1 Cyclin, N-terminal domain containing protein [Tritrichomonas foetus]
MASKKGFRRPSFSPLPLNGCIFRTSSSNMENITPNRRKVKQRQSYTPQKVITKSPKISYLTDILDSLYQRQLPPDGLSDLIQSGSKPSLRYRVVAWIARLCKHFSLRRSVMYSTVMIIDRSLHQISIKKEEMQLLGGAAFWLSVKFHCPKSVKLSQIVAEIGNANSKDDLLSFEIKILEALNYNINIPNVGDFINLLEENLSCDRPLLMLLWTLSDILLQFAGFLRFRPSTIATAVLIYSLNCLNRTFQNEIVTKLMTTEEPEVLFCCIEEIHNVVTDLLNNRKKSIIEQTSNGHYTQVQKWLTRSKLPEVESFLMLMPHNE